jgi:hypothetical protein
MFSQAINTLGLLGKYCIKRGKFIKSELREDPKIGYRAKTIYEQKAEYQVSNFNS